MLVLNRHQQGLTLIEIVIAMALGVTLMGVGAVSFRDWIRNAQIRSTAESILNGLQLARAQAVTRNAQVRFQFTSTLDFSCYLTPNGSNWVVSLDDPTGYCYVPASDQNWPRILQTRPSQEVSDNVGVVASQPVVVFGGLGRLSAVAPAAVPAAVAININHSADACATPGNPGQGVRCLRVTVSTDGQVRMCDPASNDPVQGC